MALYLYFFRRAFLQAQLANAFATSLLLGCVAYLLLGSIRGFTFVPSTYLVLLGLMFFPPWPLFLLTLLGILISSASIYFFAEALHLEDVFERKHGKYILKLRALLQKNEMPIIIGWAFFPLAPTDLICYVCGVLRVSLRKMLVGVAIGEGAVCALYIFAGGYLRDVVLRWFH